MAAVEVASRPRAETTRLHAGSTRACTGAPLEELLPLEAGKGFAMLESAR